MTTFTHRGGRTRVPGVEGIWALIGADSVIFAILFWSFMQDRLHHQGLFETSRQTLNINLGGLDTLMLLTSSWLVALAIAALKRDCVEQVSRYLMAGTLTGLLFVTVKSFEYFQKITA
jgi:nitric oxide reductase NorE protein